MTPEQTYAVRRLQGADSDPATLEAGAALAEGRLDVAQKLLRALLKADPLHVAAMRMLAELAIRLGRLKDAQHLLERAVDLVPGFHAARHNLALVHYRASRPELAIAECERILRADPQEPNARNLKAAALGQVGDYEGAVALYEPLLAKHPDMPKGWLSYGHALKTMGRRADCEAAYERAIALAPTLGEAWWSLANLKTHAFDEAALAAMRGALATPGLEVEDRLHFEFALGKALEDRGEVDASFAHYARGNALRAGQMGYDPAETTLHVDRQVARFSADFVARMAGRGCAAPDPIFIVGLPRAGSTLIEQILASHSMVEGTMELPDILALARRTAGEGGDYGPALETADLRALGAAFLERTRVHRRAGRPFFIDKMPNNFLHAGFIHLILPNARIIDARRHPLGCCFSAFKQHFARGQGFTYGLETVGRYYADYVRLMAHLTAVLPADRLTRVIYEDVVADLEGEVRRLLDWLGLPFEAQCLRFHENARAVRTASSEQVRRPIFSEGTDQWRRYAAHLGPLEAALGDVLQDWR
ncbi:tetratricopeptide repeat-containing sulfotransferase family protein [Sandaracinobacteroides saxicola]|uniref:Sulfotransferase n=1 Tax=Sandaracinobacteroides saxicola TaxID=2759707 RepID=A0A7G5IH48_9SPHN|nr:sulfotransferase [Sandaracinobacteroides saxicola]QMW22690.1 sulfotransferase [Sandaracinobacteroides saxicola]